MIEDEEEGDSVIETSPVAYDRRSLYESIDFGELPAFSCDNLCL